MLPNSPLTMSTINKTQNEHTLARNKCYNKKFHKRKTISIYTSFNKKSQIGTKSQYIFFLEGDHRIAWKSTLYTNIRYKRLLVDIFCLYSQLSRQQHIFSIILDSLSNYGADICFCVQSCQLPMTECYFRNSDRLLLMTMYL